MTEGSDEAGLQFSRRPGPSCPARTVGLRAEQGSSEFLVIRAVDKVVLTGGCSVALGVGAGAAASKYGGCMPVSDGLDGYPYVS